MLRQRRVRRARPPAVYESTRRGVARLPTAPETSVVLLQRLYGVVVVVRDDSLLRRRRVRGDRGGRAGVVRRSFAVVSRRYGDVTGSCGYGNGYGGGGGGGYGGYGDRRRSSQREPCRVSVVHALVRRTRTRRRSPAGSGGGGGGEKVRKPPPGEQRLSRGESFVCLFACLFVCSLPFVCGVPSF